MQRSGNTTKWHPIWRQPGAGRHYHLSVWPRIPDGGGCCYHLRGAKQQVLLAARPSDMYRYIQFPSLVTVTVTVRYLYMEIVSVLLNGFKRINGVLITVYFACYQIEYILGSHRTPLKILKNISQACLQYTLGACLPEYFCTQSCQRIGRKERLPSLNNEIKQRPLCILVRNYL